jgi:hypothetical protein
MSPPAVRGRAGRPVPGHGGEVRLHPLGQLEALVLFEHPGEAALAGLRIDADHRFVAAAEVGRVDRQVGHRPQLVVAVFLRGEALLDRVLMAARKGGEHQFAAIGMAFGHGQLVAVFDRLDHLVDVGEIEARIDALRVHVERDRHQAAVAGALAIAEQAAFDAVGAGHQAQFRRRHAGAPVVVGVQLITAPRGWAGCGRNTRSGRRRCWASPPRPWPAG